MRTPCKRGHGWKVKANRVELVGWGLFGGADQAGRTYRSNSLLWFRPAEGLGGCPALLCGWLVGVYVAAAIAHFVALEVVVLVESIGRIGLVAG
jgi:hypothetical protein